MTASKHPAIDALLHLAYTANIETLAARKEISDLVEEVSKLKAELEELSTEATDGSLEAMGHRVRIAIAIGLPDGAPVDDIVAAIESSPHEWPDPSAVALSHRCTRCGTTLGEYARDPMAMCEPREPVCNCAFASSSWCPVHGQCTCERDEDGDRKSNDEGWYFNAPDCPIHKLEDLEEEHMEMEDRKQCTCTKDGTKITKTDHKCELHGTAGTPCSSCEKPAWREDGAKSSWSSSDKEYLWLCADCAVGF